MNQHPHTLLPFKKVSTFKTELVYLLMCKISLSGDVYVHADLHGATSCVIKNPSGKPCGFSVSLYCFTWFYQFVKILDFIFSLNLYVFLPFSTSPYSFSRRPHPSSYPDRSWHYGCVLQCCLGCQDHHQRLVGSSSSGVSSIYIDRYSVYIYTHISHTVYWLSIFPIIMLRDKSVSVFPLFVNISVGYNSFLHRVTLTWRYKECYQTWEMLTWI